MLLPILFTFLERSGLEYNALLRFRQPDQTAVYYVNDADGDTVVFKKTVDEVPATRAARFANDGKFRIAQRVVPIKGKMSVRWSALPRQHAPDQGQQAHCHHAQLRVGHGACQIVASGSPSMPTRPETSLANMGMTSTS